VTTPDRFERDLPELFDELAAARMPDYFDDFLRRSAHTRQRPGWTFPERWIPMSAITSRAATTPRPSWRLVGLVALLLIALALGAVLLAGSQVRRVPAPFGVAGNGLIAYVDAGGAINVGDPATGQSHAIVPGPANVQPAFSPDGTRIAFLHTGLLNETEIVVVRADGTGRTVITARPIGAVSYLNWTPDSASVAVVSASNILETYDAGRAGPPRIVTSALTADAVEGFNPHAAAFFRPPDGRQVLFIGTNGPSKGVVVMDADGSNVRTLVDHSRPDIDYLDLSAAQWSPDGTRISFVATSMSGTNDGRVFVMNADGTGLRQLSRPIVPLAGGDFLSDGHAVWSPDGTRIAVQRWINHDATGGAYEVRPITIIGVDDGTVTEVGDVSPNGFNSWGWSPDGTSILEIPDLASIGQATANRVVIVDVPSGRSHETTWTTGTPSAWQRVAP
jgi:Tol biopolymer transport system component